MKLSEILRPWSEILSIDTDITGLQNDSRKVKKGDLFLAYPGSQSDGRRYIHQAISAGAAAIAYDPQDCPAEMLLTQPVTFVAIPELHIHLGEIAKRFFHHPEKEISITGVTGTNGKTTIAYQLAQAHALLGMPSAYIGTIGQGMVSSLQPLANTTPDALSLISLLHDYQQQHIQQVCMEVSSHALSQHRVDDLEFNQAIFTNLTLDHLDYHQTMQQYAEAKAKLFAWESLEWVIINKDDAYAEKMSHAVRSGVKQLTYGLHAKADIQAISWHMDMKGTQIEVASPWGKYDLHITSLGEFNIYNSLAVFGSLLASGYAPDKVLSVMAKLKAAPGRLERVTDSPCVLVDYAHTPDALENVLTTLSQLKRGRLWVVFGCGGDRDKSKRPIMGKAASQYADEIIITSDNPRSEDPVQIVEEIAEGIPASIAVTKMVDREKAIAHALKAADKDDIILIAGKGHEDYQQIGSVKYPFSDQAVVRKLML